MNKIEVFVLNKDVVQDSEKMMVCAARLTQKGHMVKSMSDFINLYNKPYTTNTVTTMTKLPHPTIQKFGVINIVVVGASRRFLAQVTRHQNEVKFMSASLQYSDYTGNADFVVPYNVLKNGDKAVSDYINTCNNSMTAYATAIDTGLNHDEAGYLAPQSLRNILIISATPYQWKHMIGQRICRRNTLETRYVFLRIWEQLYALAPNLFSMETTGPFCMQGNCKEGNMTCGKPICKSMSPTDILSEDFQILMRGTDED